MECKVIKFPVVYKVAQVESDEDLRLKDKLERIRNSIEKINLLMQKLKEVQK